MRDVDLQGLLATAEGAFQIAAGEERKASPALQPGARLLREWNGITHVVDVLPDGFHWNGRPHRSLSAIARAITGARWSGPRFFGLISALDDAGGNVAKRKAATAKRVTPSDFKPERAA